MNEDFETVAELREALKGLTEEAAAAVEEAKRNLVNAHRNYNDALARALRRKFPPTDDPQTPAPAGS